MDQRSKREMFIGGVHKKDTLVLQRRDERKKQIQEKEMKEKERVAAQKKEQTEANLTFFSEDQEEPQARGKRKESDLDYNPEPVVKVRQKNTHSLENTAHACDHMGTSSRAATIICNSYAMDMGWLTHENRLTETLDKSKLDKWRKRERERTRAKEEKEISSRPVRSVYFDGKKLQHS